MELASHPAFSSGVRTTASSRPDPPPRPASSLAAFGYSAGLGNSRRTSALNTAQRGVDGDLRSTGVYPLNLGSRRRRQHSGSMRNYGVTINRQQDSRSVPLPEGPSTRNGTIGPESFMDRTLVHEDPDVLIPRRPLVFPERREREKVLQRRQALNGVLPVNETQQTRQRRNPLEHDRQQQDAVLGAVTTDERFGGYDVRATSSRIPFFTSSDGAAGILQTSTAGNSVKTLAQSNIDPQLRRADELSASQSQERPTSEDYSQRLRARDRGSTNFSCAGYSSSQPDANEAFRNVGGVQNSATTKRSSSTSTIVLPSSLAQIGPEEQGNSSASMVADLMKVIKDFETKKLEGISRIEEALVARVEINELVSRTFRGADIPTILALPRGLFVEQVLEKDDLFNQLERIMESVENKA